MRCKNPDLAAAALALAIASTACLAQTCVPQWTAGLFDLESVGGEIRAMVSYDPDGPGPNPPVLVIAGAFNSIGGVAVTNIAQWDGSQWSPLGSGVTLWIQSMVVLDAGTTHPSIVVAGPYVQSAGGVSVMGVARWDGATWSPLGAGLAFAGGPMTVVAEAQGDVLYVATFNGVSRWDGSTWWALPPPPGPSQVLALCAFEDPVAPGAPSLVAASRNNGSPTVTTVSRWTGSSWVPYGAPVPSLVLAMRSFDADGAGPGPAELFIGGTRNNYDQPPLPLARWDGSTWVAINLPCTSGSVCSSDTWVQVKSLEVFDADGPGPAVPVLIAAGTRVAPSFLPLPAPPSLHTGFAFGWNGSVLGPANTLTFLGDPLDSTTVNAIAALQGGAGPQRLFAGGFFRKADGSSCQSLAEWTGGLWRAVGNGVPGPVYASIVHDVDGPGPGPPALYVGGAFAIATPTGIARGVAKWDGTAWSPVGAGPGQGPGDPTVTAFALFDEDGPGPGLPSLFAGGSLGPFTSVSKWDGSTWTPLPATGNSIGCGALAAFDPDGGGPAPGFLVAACSSYAFLSITQVHLDVQYWNGTSWTSIGVTPYTNPPSIATALAVFDEDGPGPGLPGLYLTGAFPSINGVAATDAARWNGIAWAPTGLPPGNALAVFDEDGSGPALARLFCATQTGIVAWDGTNVSAIGATAGGPIRTLGVHDPDGSGVPRLYAGGTFASIDGLPANDIASWDGTGWSALGSGVTGGSVSTICSYAEPSSALPGRAVLYAGGSFTTAGGFNSGNFARWATEPNLALGFVAPGNGDLIVQNTSCLPGASYFSTFSFDPLNATYPGGGWWAGLFIDVGTIVTQYNIGAPPFVGALDASGASSYTVPQAVILPAAGLTVWGVTRTYDPVLYVPLAASPVASRQL